MRSIGVITTSRADYGIYRSILRRIQEDSELELRLMATGMHSHVSSEQGLTLQEIEDDGFEIFAQVPMQLSSDTPAGTGKSIASGVSGFAQLFAASAPDILMVLGDRFEMFAAALAALPYKLPLAHLHGGEVTSGAYDEALRHCLTKMSHLHFVATTEYAKRVIQLGEEPWRVTLSGAPSLDNLMSFELMDYQALKEAFDLDLSEPPLLITFHVTTLEYEQAAWQTEELLAALEVDIGESGEEGEKSKVPLVFTMPNADTGGSVVRELIGNFVSRTPWAQAVESFGTQGYFSLMAYARAMVGNSSSGLIEAASFHLPVVNIGTRQDGRIRLNNVIDVGYGRDEVTRGIELALDESFRAGLAGLVNPFYVGRSADIIVSRLKEVEIGDRLVMKRFFDISMPDVGRCPD